MARHLNSHQQRARACHVVIANSPRAPLPDRVPAPPQSDPNCVDGIGLVDGQVRDAPMLVLLGCRFHRKVEGLALQPQQVPSRMPALLASSELIPMVNRLLHKSRWTTTARVDPTPQPVSAQLSLGRPFRNSSPARIHIVTENKLGATPKGAAPN